MRDDGAISFDIEAPESKVDDCITAALAELPKLKSPDYFTDEELKNAAHRIDVAYAKEREGTEGYAHQISTMWAQANLDYYATYSDRLHAVTRADIAKYLDTYILGKPFVLGALESPRSRRRIDKAHLEKLAGIGTGKKGAK